jgi:hypothetical protein
MSVLESYAVSAEQELKWARLRPAKAVLRYLGAHIGQNESYGFVLRRITLNLAPAAAAPTRAGAASLDAVFRPRRRSAQLDLRLREQQGGIS